MRTRLNNLGLEKKLNDLLSAGNEAMRLSRKQFWEDVVEGERSGSRQLTQFQYRHQYLYSSKPVLGGPPESVNSS